MLETVPGTGVHLQLKEKSQPSWCSTRYSGDIGNQQVKPTDRSAGKWMLSLERKNGRDTGTEGGKRQNQRAGRF